MDAGALDVLHNARDEHVGAVGDDVHLQLDAAHILVDEDGVLDALRKNDVHIRADVVFAVGDGHILPADDVGRPQQHGVADAFGGPERLLHRLDAQSLRALDAELAQQPVEPLAVLGGVDALGRGAEDADALGVEELGQLDGRLPAEGDDDADGVFGLDDAPDVLLGQRLEVQPVGDVEVGGHRLGVVVDDDDLVAQLAERLRAVDRGVVELDALPDADGAGA